MKTLSGTCIRNSVYCRYYLVFVVVLSLFCLLISKPDGFLLINRFHCKLFDYFFALVTNMGNGLFVIAAVVFLLFRKKFVWSLQVGVSFLISGLLVQLFKHLVHSPRPKIFFGSNAIHCIYGITCTGFNSFPSGHTTTIFAFTTLLSFYFPDRRSGLFFLGIAVLTGFSRIYLSDHFPIDVLAGSVFGVLISMTIYLLIPLKIVEGKVPEPGIDSQSINLQ